MLYDKRKYFYFCKVNLYYFCYILQDSFSKGFDIIDIDNDVCLFVDKFLNDFSFVLKNVKDLF